jgi:hypothetical protein
MESIINLPNDRCRIDSSQENLLGTRSWTNAYKPVKGESRSLNSESRSQRSSYRTIRGDECAIEI